MINEATVQKWREAMDKSSQALRELGTANRDLMNKLSKAEFHLKVIRMQSTEENIQQQATKALLEVAPHAEDTPSNKGFLCEGED